MRYILLAVAVLMGIAIWLDYKGIRPPKQWPFIIAVPVAGIIILWVALR